jgi:hypothetical protein
MATLCEPLLMMPVTVQATGDPAGAATGIGVRPPGDIEGSGPRPAGTAKLARDVFAVATRTGFGVAGIAAGMTVGATVASTVVPINGTKGLRIPGVGAGASAAGAALPAGAEATGVPGVVAVAAAGVAVVAGAGFAIGAAVAADAVGTIILTMK